MNALIKHERLQEFLTIQMKSYTIYSKDLGPVKRLQIFFVELSKGSKPSTTFTKSFF